MSESFEIPPIPARRQTHLRANALPFAEVLAQSVANIAPSITPALTIPLVFASAGGATWLTFLLSTAGLILVGLNISVFAKRSATPGSLYNYANQGLGRTAGFLAGWAMILAYVVCGSAVMFGFALYAIDLCKQMGFNVSPYVLYVGAALVTWLCAYKDVRLSAATMLALEGVSMAAMLALGVLVFFVDFKYKGIDLSQFDVQTFSPSGIRLGMVLAIFAYVGFESAASLGFEARNPTKAIPRSIVFSMLIAGLFFMLLSYAEIAGFRGIATTLDKSQKPLIDLAEFVGVRPLGVITSIGAALSFFGCVLACINAVGRIVYAMGCDGELFSKFGDAHESNQTPHLAMTFAALAMLAITTAMQGFGVVPVDGYGICGSFSVFGFLTAYIIVSIAAPIYLYRQNKMHAGHVALAIASLAFMALPLIGSVYPIPPPPYDRLPYLFIAYMAVGTGVWTVTARRRPANELIMHDGTVPAET